MTVAGRGVVVAATAMALLVLSACSPASKETPRDGDAPSAVTGGSGTGGDGPPGQGGDLPVGAGEDFPIAMPAGWEIDLYAKLGFTDASGGVQLLYPDGAFDDIVGLYEDWTAGQPEDYARTDAGDITIFAAPDTTISASGSHDEGGERFRSSRSWSPANAGDPVGERLATSDGSGGGDPAAARWGTVRRGPVDIPGSCDDREGSPLAMG